MTTPGTFTDLPDFLQPQVQEGWLEKEFEFGVKSKLAYRMNADQESFKEGIGETRTKTRKGRKAPVTVPLDAAAVNASLNNGITPTRPPLEQWSFDLNDYADSIPLNLRQDKVQIKSDFLVHAKTNGEQSSQSLEWLARNKLFNAYAGGDARVCTSLGAGGVTTAYLDDIRGFEKVMYKGKLRDVTGSMTLTAQAITPTGTKVALVINTVTEDDPNRSSAAGSGGRSGMITFVALGGALPDGTRVIAANASSIFRSKGAPHTAALTGEHTNNLSLLQAAKTRLQMNGMEPFDDGFYHYIGDAESINQFFEDPKFQTLYQGTGGRSREYNEGEIFTLMGCKFITTTEAFQQEEFEGLGGAHNIGVRVKRPILMGAGAVVQCNFDGNSGWLESVGGSRTAMMQKVGDIMMITRSPIDNLQLNIVQSWLYGGDFGIPSNMTTNTSIMPTAKNELYKRAVMMEHAA